MSALVTAVALVLTACPSALSSVPDGSERAGRKTPEMLGRGGAVSSVDHDASRIGMAVLRNGGNAVDAAVATAAALGVTEPYSSGIGGGGFFVHFDADSGRVHTIDGRETAPAAMRPDSFLDPATGRPLPFDEAVNSGLSVGVPGTVATWESALREWGTWELDEAIKPAVALARDGFLVDQNFHDQTRANAKRFAEIAPTAELFLPGGQPPKVGSRFRNPDLARTYELIADNPQDFYRGRMAREIARTAQRPPVVPGATMNFRPGLLTEADIADYRTRDREPTTVNYRGLDIVSMAPPSSGGTTVGEALNMLERFDLEDETTALHRYLDASRAAFADRNRWVGDPRNMTTTVDRLLDKRLAEHRVRTWSEHQALPHPAPWVDVNNLPEQGPNTPATVKREGESTTHLVTADRWGDVVSYTLTIESTGGSAITVPDRGFLLNNELTDFNFVPHQPGVPDPNLPGPGLIPRSSMAPTLVLRDGRPVLALGSPGGPTIITTVLQILMYRLDLEYPLLDAVAAPRLTQRNTAVTEVEAEFLDTEERHALERRGHRFAERPTIGAAAALEFLSDGRVRAVAEPVRQGGGSAIVQWRH